MQVLLDDGGTRITSTTLLQERGKGLQDKITAI